MDEPKSLDSLFKEKIFRIPDYQRGYAWQREQFKAFWEDLVNLSDGRSHYTGVLTLKQIPARGVAENSNEYWLVDDHSYQIYHIVDGQQRLTTFIVFIQALVDFVKMLPENHGRPDETVYLTDSLNLSALQSRFLFKTKPTGDQFRTYKFGYTEDNPSYEYLRHRILDEPGGGSVQETFYTLNLSNAKTYFDGQLRELHAQDGMDGIQDVYRKLTKRFLFNEYVIKDEFDVFVAFETMNNRGKKLSDLELLKNRLIYLTTLYSDAELDPASRKSLRDIINDAWKEVYKQLGRNKSKPLNDDEFLRAHWILYYKYSRKTGYDYIRFLLDEQFTPQRIHKKVEKDVVLEQTVEQKSGTDFEDEELEADEDDAIAEAPPTLSADLSPTEIRDYVRSLKECAAYWFNSYHPHLAEGMAEEECRWVNALNRLGIAYFRPLVMAILKKEKSQAKRIRVFQRIERFIFILFRLNALRSNSGSSQFSNSVRRLDRGEISVDDIERELDKYMAYTFLDDGAFRANYFHSVLFRKFKSGSGYYGWSGIRYFLYEYELSLLTESRQKKVEWEDLLKSPKDKISIEHIYPQTPTEPWKVSFSTVPEESLVHYSGGIGNLLLLSSLINSSLQNDSFEEKKRPKYDSEDHKLRNGYSDGSHSEIEVSAQPSWGPEEIRERGLKLLKFMERRWDFTLKEDDRESLLFLNRAASPDGIPPAAPADSNISPALPTSS